MSQGDLEINILRRNAHIAFDQLWKRKVVTRETAYQKLALLLDKKREDAHFKYFTREECRKVLEMIGGMRVPHLRDRVRHAARQQGDRREGLVRRAAVERMRLREREELS